MADFSAALPHILENEGGYSHDGSDSGGGTYCGISRVNFPNWGGWNIIDDHKPLGHGEILNITELVSQVKNFYYTQFWQSVKGDLITSQGLATYLFDSIVNCGVTHPIKWLQTALGVSVDGILGGGTLFSLNGQDDKAILTKLHKARCDYYYEIGHGVNARFLNGWISRAQTLYDKMKDC